jgi:thymidylate kinase
MDFLHRSDYYESYAEYQTRIIEQFDGMADEFDFHLIDATRSVHDVFADLQKGIHKLIKGMKPASPRISKKGSGR